MNRLKENLSIIISAYRVENFIEQALDSIFNQKNYNLDQVEVLVGIDGCQTTKQKLELIRNNYPKFRLRIIYFHNNVGTYIVCNTLITIAKYNNIIRFDSDDIMTDKMLYTIMSQNTKYNVIKFSMMNFEDSNPNVTEIYKIASEGCRFFTKKLFMLVGGYMPWRHTADSEFNNRIMPVTCELYIEEVLLKRRRHANALTKCNQTKIDSPERNAYRDKIMTNFNLSVIRIPMVTDHNYEVLFDLQSYWEERYATGGNSGKGSYNEEAQVKAEYINKLIIDKHIQTIQEYGSGDGNNLLLYKGFKHYNGYDISKTSIEICKHNKKINQKTCSFTSNVVTIDYNADLALCLDVLFHQVEDRDYLSLLKLIFTANHSYILLYTTNEEKLSAQHVRHRKTLEDVKRLYPDYTLIDSYSCDLSENKLFLLYKR